MATIQQFTITGATAEGWHMQASFAADGNDMLAEMIDAMNQMWQAGVYPSTPEWALEHRYEVVSRVIVRHQINDGRTTPVVALYSDKPYLVNKVVHIYLNNNDDIAEFEAHTGLKLSALPVLRSETFPQLNRGNYDDMLVNFEPIGVLTYKQEAKEEGGFGRIELKRWIPLTTDANDEDSNVIEPDFTPPASPEDDPKTDTSAADKLRESMANQADLDDSIPLPPILDNIADNPARDHYETLKQVVQDRRWTKASGALNAAWGVTTATKLPLNVTVRDVYELLAKYHAA